MIGLRTALLIYAVLGGLAALALHGKFLVLGLILIAAVAFKTLLHYYKEKSR